LRANDYCAVLLAQQHITFFYLLWFQYMHIIDPSYLMKSEKEKANKGDIV